MGYFDSEKYLSNWKIDSSNYNENSEFVFEQNVQFRSSIKINL
jgi:hypothetical protein